VVALTFIYTRCPLPDFCPRMNRHFSAVQAALLDDPQLRLRSRLLSLSLDPDYDTPAVLAAHARQANADPRVWSFLGGSREAIDRFAVPFGVYVVRDDKNPGTITHNLRTAVIAADGRLVTVFSGGDWTPADLLAALRLGR
jgi:protein SCO1/2